LLVAELWRADKENEFSPRSSYVTFFDVLFSFEQLLQFHKEEEKVLFNVVATLWLQLAQAKLAPKPRGGMPVS